MTAWAEATAHAAPVVRAEPVAAPASLHHANGAERGEAPSVGYGGFHIGGMALALPMTALREVLPCPGLVPLPAASTAVAGALSVRGVHLPVLDLLHLLGRRQTSVQQACVVVLVMQGRLLGLLVDSVSGVFRARAGSWQGLQAPGSVSAVLAASLVRDDDGSTVTVLSPEALFGLDGVPTLTDPEPERAALPEGQAQAQASATALQRPYMLMRCGRVALALDALAVHTTISNPELAPSVLAQGACRGVADVGGLPVPMVDLPALCGLGALDPSRRWQAAVLRCESVLVGLLVDAVADVVQAPADALLPVPAFVLRHPAFFEGVLPSTALPPEVLRRSGVVDTQCLVLDARALASAPELLALGEALGARNRASQSERAAVDAREPMLTFEVDGEVAVPIGQVVEILPFNLTPGAYAWPPQLLGMVTLRGRCIPVMCMRQLCGLPPPAPSVDASVLVVTVDGEWVGFAVPRLRSIESARSAMTMPRANPEAADGRQPLVSLGHGASERLVPLVDLHERARNLLRGAPGGV